MSFLSQLFGSSGQSKQIPTMNPQQLAQQQQSLQQFGPLSQQLQKPFDINPIINQRQQSFQTNTVPSLAERFTSLGGSGQRSSAFANALGRAGSDLETQLASLQSQVGLQDLNRQQSLLGLLGNIGFQPSFENAYQQGDPGLLGHAAQGAGMGLGLYAGGLAGGAAGAGGGILDMLSKWLGGRQDQQGGMQSNNSFGMGGQQQGAFSPQDRMKLLSLIMGQ